jgi:hypothetical protein
MRRPVAALTLALLTLMLIAAPAGAITGGQPDNGAHPQVGMAYNDEWVCSGTLIAPTVFLTAGHCTADFAAGTSQVYVTFAEQADFDPAHAVTGTAYTHPGFDLADWPFTIDIGVVVLDEAVDLPLATLPEIGLLDTVIPRRGATKQVFIDVGYGLTNAQVGGGPPRPNFTAQRRQARETYHPGGNRDMGVIHGLTDLLLMLKANPSPQHGGGCPGDSGGPIFLGESFTLVAVHTGGYGVGFEQVLCGRLSSLNHRLDTAIVQDWLAQFLD